MAPSRGVTQSKQANYKNVDDKNKRHIGTKATGNKIGQKEADRQTKRTKI